MSDNQSLLAILAVIYLADCIYWVPRAGLSVTRWIGPKWKLRDPSATFGNQKGAIALANPLPPLGVASRCAGQGLDTDAILKRVAEFDRISKPLRTMGNILFVFLFIISPLVVWRFGVLATLLPLIAGIYAQAILISWRFAKAHKQLYPTRSADRLTPLLTMLLAAPSAVRAQDILGRPLLEEFHPLAVAKALCLDADFQTLAPQILRRAKFPPGNAAPDDRFLSEIESNLRISAADFVKPPAPTDPSHKRYCARCLQQFTADAKVCNDCVGRPLDDLICAR